MLQHQKLYFLCFCILIIIGCNSSSTNVEFDLGYHDSIYAAKQWAKLFKGQIQTSGLSSKEQKTLGLGEIQFQLIGDSSYFLVMDKKPQHEWEYLENNWGKCVEIDGEIYHDSSLNNIEIYGRKVLKVKGLHPNSIFCLFAEPAKAILKGKKDTFTGKIRRVIRPRPDIDFDYELVLDIQFIDNKRNNRGHKQLKSILLTADKKEIIQFEEAIDKNYSVQIEGLQTSGYAKDLVFAVNAVKILK